MAKEPPRKRKHRLNTIFTAIGEVAVSWAYLETGVDLCIRIIHFECGGHSMGIEIPRTSFARKMEYLSKAYDKLHGFSAMFENLKREVIPLLEAAAEERHKVIHGVATNIEAYPHSGILEIQRRRMTKTALQVETGKTTVKMIREFRGHVVSLGAFVLDFAKILEEIGAKRQ